MPKLIAAFKALAALLVFLALCSGCSYTRVVCDGGGSWRVTRLSLAQEVAIPVLSVDGVGRLVGYRVGVASNAAPVVSAAAGAALKAAK